MNTALLDRPLSLIADPYKAEFTLKRYSDPNMNFKLAFQVFLDNYSATIEHDREENKNRTKAPCALHDRWLILHKRIDNEIIYALFAQHGISDKDVVDMTMQVILKTGLFTLEYGK